MDNMKKLLLAAAVLIISAAVTLQASNYKKVRTENLSANQIEQLQQFGFAIENYIGAKDGALEFFVNNDEFKILQDSGLPFTVLIEDWELYYKSLPQLTEAEKAQFISESKSFYGVEGFGYGSMGGFYTYAEIVQKLDEMYSQFPNLITEKYSIGTSWGGRTIWAVKISDNPNISEDEPQAFFDALIHAREPASMASVMYYMFYLLENYGTDPEVTYLVNNREIYFVPCFNPDGYEYNRTTNPSGGGMWRKNRRNNSDNDGVDLNRNFGYMWGYDNIGSSSIPSSETYRGPSAFSEPETQAIRNLAVSKNFKTYINYHSYTNAIIYPWGYIDQETPDSLVYREYASDMSRWNGYITGNSTQTIGYASNGTARDWFYGEQNAKIKAFGYTFEVGSDADGFWPSQSRIFPLAQGNLRPNLYNTWVAGEYVSFTEAQYSSEYLLPGESYTLIPKFKNKGLSTANDLLIEIVSLNEYLEFENASFVIDSIPPREEFIPVTPVDFSLNEFAPTGQKLFYEVKTVISSAVMSRDTLWMIPGMPVFIFNDTNNDPSLLWTITASPATPKWEATTSAFHSSPTAYTDSKTSTYANNANVKMIMKDPVSLNGISSAVLSYWSKWDIEANWDCGQVYISTNNGTTWQVLVGSFTVPGAGQGAQPANEPVYEGAQTAWVYEEIDLSDYVGNDVKIKFELRSDGSLQKDGWYLDDIQIYYYGANSSNFKCVDVAFISGWNLLSVPVLASNMSAAYLFPSAASPAFGYNDGYVLSDILNNDYGYWVKFSQEGMVNICGNRIDGIIPVMAGWNIIGGNDTSVAVSQITSNPPGIVETFFFGYNGGYSTASSLEPGKGYWVRTSESGELNLNTSAQKNSASETVNGIEIIITDASGDKAVLLLASDFSGSFDMPPSAPDRSFEVSFTGNKIGTAESSGEILIEKAVFPLSIEVKNGDIVLMRKGIPESRVVQGEKYILADPSITLLKVSQTIKLDSYRLYDNYPNPFNPATVITYELKSVSQVSLRVFDVLGREAAVLVNSMQAEGKHSISFDASDLSSGVYFYSLEAKGKDGSGYRAVKKMILMK